MDCSWIKIYDAAIGGNELDPNSLRPGQNKIFIDISEMPSEYEFLGWKDISGNAIGDDVISLVKGGRYSTTSQCGSNFVASVRVKEESVCSLVAIPFDPKMGDVTPTGIQYGCNKTVEISATPKCCYEFVSWNDDEGPDVHSPDRTVTILSGSARYIAYFDPIRYTIQVFANNDAWGRVTGPEDNVICEQSFIIEAIPEEGYAFVKWDDENTEARREITFECDGKRVYTATFAPDNEYLITYNVNYGQEPETIEQGYFQTGAPVTFMNGPERENYIFLGWSTEKTASQPDSTFPPGETGTYDWIESITLYAIWKRRTSNKFSYMVGGTAYGSSSHTEGDVVILEGDPYNGGSVYIFLGWRVTEESTEPSENVPIIGAGGTYIMGPNQTYAHAVFAEDDGTVYNTLKYVFGDGFETQVIGGIINGSNVTIQHPLVFDVNFGEIHKDFITWTLTTPPTGITYQPGSTLQINTDTVLTAEVKDQTPFEIKYFDNCDNSVTPTQTVYTDSSYPSEPIITPDMSSFTCDDNIFKGWSEDRYATFATYGPETIFVPTADMVLYGIWQKAPKYNVYYIDNYNCGITDANDYSDGDTVIVKPCNCMTQDGCHCTGWVDGDGNEYEGNETFQIHHNTILNAVFDCCLVRFRTMGSVTITIDGTAITDNTKLNIDDNTEFDVEVGDNQVFLGWYDATNGTYIDPCEEPSSYKYVMVPYTLSPSSNVIVELSNEDFIDAIENNTQMRDSFIKNLQTGEIRERVGVCSASEEYSLSCGSTVFAIAAPYEYTQTDGQDGNEYVKYDSRPYSDFYSYLNSNPTYDTLPAFVEVVISGISCYYAVHRGGML